VIGTMGSIWPRPDEDLRIRGPGISTGALVRVGGICIGGYRTREPRLQLEQGYAEAMQLGRSKPGQVGKFSWIAERAASSEVVIGTVQ